MDAKLSEAINRYKELTKGLKGKELQKAINDFRCGNYTQDLYPTHNKQ